MPSQRQVNLEARKLLTSAQVRENRGMKLPRPGKGKSKGQPAGWREAVAGMVLMVLTIFALQRVGLGTIPLFRGDHALGVAAVLGLLLGISRVRNLLWVVAGVVVAAMLVVAYTPLVHPLIRQCVRRDPLRPVEAVVVLGSDIWPDGQMNDAAQFRFLRGYEVIREGFAKRMVVTRLQPPKGSYLPALRAQAERLDFDFPIEETGQVGNTHDEAIQVSRLARERGWEEVILVSDAWHLRRAGAVFEKAGLKVICTPCPDREYDLDNLSTPMERIDAFRNFLWEWGGYQIYRFRGWI